MRIASNDFGQVLFNDLEEMREAVKNCGILGGRDSGRDTDWTGSSDAQLINQLQNGDNKAVAEAERILEKIQFDLATDQSEMTAGWLDDVSGAFANVPAFLAGSPENMRRKIMEAVETPSVTIWVDVTSSGGINHQDLYKRGMAILALVMQLRLRRYSVSLATFTSLSRGSGGGARTGNAVVITKIPMETVDISMVAFLLTSVGYARSICYKLAYASGGGGGWASGASPSSDYKTRIKAARNVLLKGQASESDVIIPLTYGHDAKSASEGGMMFTQPAKWIQMVLDEMAAGKASATNESTQW